MKLLITILSILLFIMPEQKTDKVLEEDIYTNTGYGCNDQMEPVNGKTCSSFYVRIYSNKLIKTMSVWGHYPDEDQYPDYTY